MCGPKPDGYRSVAMILTLTALVWSWAPPAQAQSSAAPGDSDSWEFKATLYLWIAGAQGAWADTSGFGGPINESFKDMVENIKIGGMAHLSGKKRAWGFEGDFFFANLEGKSPNRSGSGDIDVKVDMILGEGDVTFGFPTLRFVGGVRVLNVEQTVTIPAGSSESGSATIVDPILGAQGEWALADDWTFLLRGDVGGYGLGSELTYQVLYGFGWKFADQWTLDFGYRMIGYNIQEDEVKLDMTIHGLVGGVGFAF